MIAEYFALINLLNNSTDWRAEMENRHIAIKEDGDFVLFKYNQLFSDMNDPVVRACRGVIFDHSKGLWAVVCAPFVKFAYGEEAWERPIDWSTAIVREKVDGSLMKAWCCNGKWHLSTNGTINAFAAEVGDTGLTFGELFERAINDTFEHWAGTHLFGSHTYMFELTSPLNKIVVDYSDTKIWLLGTRKMSTLQEDDSISVRGVDRPHFYDLTSMKDVLAVVAGMDGKEGVVVMDGNFNRIKVKSPDYLMKHHMANNGVLTLRRIVGMIQDLSVDDYLAFIGDNTGRVSEVQSVLARLTESASKMWDEAVYQRLDLAARRDFAMWAKNYWCSDFLFKKYDGYDGTAADYLINMSTNKLIKIITKEMSEK